MPIKKFPDIKISRGIKDLKMTDKKVEIIAWFATASFFVAYFLVSFGFVSAEGTFYQVLNMSGALGLGIQAWHKWIKQVMCVEAFWILIGLVALARVHLF